MRRRVGGDHAVMGAAQSLEWRRRSDIGDGRGAHALAPHPGDHIDGGPERRRWRATRIAQHGAPENLERAAELKG